MQPSNNLPYVPRDRFDLRATSYSPDRVGRYNEANRDFPDARARERDLLLERLRLLPGQILCDVGAGGGYLAEAALQQLGDPACVICVENSQSFLDTIDPRFRRVLSSLSSIDLAASSVDRVCSLAGLHHQEDKPAFFGEAFRLLKPGGRVVVADVLAGSPQDHFLNIAVNQYTPIGHDGMFVHSGEFSAMLQQAGFVDIEEEVTEYTWDLPDRTSLVHFCKQLFRMDRATLAQVEEAIEEHLMITTLSASAHLHWSLVHAAGNKPA